MSITIESIDEIINICNEKLELNKSDAELWTTLGIVKLYNIIVY